MIFPKVFSGFLGSEKGREKIWSHEYMTNRFPLCFLGPVAAYVSLARNGPLHAKRGPHLGLGIFHIIPLGNPGQRHIPNEGSLNHSKGSTGSTDGIL